MAQQRHTPDRSNLQIQILQKLSRSTEELSLLRNGWQHLRPDAKRIAEVAAISAPVGYELRDGSFYVRVIVVKLLQNLSMTIACEPNMAKVRLNLDTMTNLILENYAHKFTLSGLSHCFELIQLGEAPFDRDEVWFRTRDVMKCLRQYLAEDSRRGSLNKSSHTNKPKGEPTEEGLEYWRRQALEAAERLGQKWRAPDPGRYENRVRRFESIESYCRQFGIDPEPALDALAKHWAEKYEKGKSESLLRGNRLGSFESFVVMENSRLLMRLNQGEHTELHDIIETKNESVA